MYNKRQIGSKKEHIAAQYLQEKGYHILDMNYQVRQGEIDIVAKKDEYLIFTEVKYRRNNASGHALEAVTMAKQRQVCKTALFYLNQKKLNPDDCAIRFDVVGITGSKITHIENAFSFIV